MLSNVLRKTLIIKTLFKKLQYIDVTAVTIHVFVYSNNLQSDLILFFNI